MPEQTEKPYQTHFDILPLGGADMGDLYVVMSCTEEVENWALVQNCRFSEPKLVEIISEDRDTLRIIEYGFGQSVYNIPYVNVIMTGTRKDLSRKLKTFLHIYNISNNIKEHFKSLED